MLRHLIKTRLYSSTPREVVKYGNKYGIHISLDQAEQLMRFIKSEKIDPFSQTDRSRTFDYISKTIGEEEAIKADQLLHALAKQYNLDNLL